MCGSLPPSTLLAPTAPAPARLRLTPVLIWLPASAVQGALIAWMAVLAQDYYAPLVVFPLLVGVGLGATSAGMTRALQVGHRPTIVAGLLLAVVLSVVGQHYLCYRQDLARTQADVALFHKAQQLAPEFTVGSGPLPPASFGDYLRQGGRPLRRGHEAARGATAWVSWGVDAVLVLVAAVAVMLPAFRQPYCSCCRSWYRTIRSGRLSSAAGLCLASRTGMSLLGQPPWVRFRLSDCNNGCGPTRLMLFWEDSQGTPAAAETWLTAEGRGCVTTLLDQPHGESPGNTNHSEGN